MRERLPRPLRGLAMTTIVALLTTSYPQPIPAWAFEQPPKVSLDQLLEELRRVNPDLLAARKRWEAAQARIPLSRGLPAPKIGVEFEEIPRGTVKINQATAMYQFLQALPFPGKISLRHQVAVKDAQIAGMLFKQREWEMVSELKSAYYSLYQADRELEIEREKQLWLRQAAGAAESRYSIGKTSQADLLRAQSELLASANQVQVLTHRRQALEAHLNHLLNRSPSISIGLPADILLTPVPASPEELLKTASENQPELLVFQFSAERAESAWKLAKRELFPDFETMLELRDPAMGPIGPWDFSLALVLPFWFWTKQRYGVRVALYDKESAQAAYQAMRSEIARRIHERWHEASAAYDTAKLCQEGLVPLARQAVASSLTAYQAGGSSFMDLLGALENLSEKERTYYQHLAQLEQQMAMLEQAVGVPLGRRMQVK